MVGEGERGESFSLPGSHKSATMFVMLSSKVVIYYTALHFITTQFPRVSILSGYVPLSPGKGWRGGSGATPSQCGVCSLQFAEGSVHGLRHIIK